MKGEVRHINGKRVATTEYRSWAMMKNRCLNPKAIDYARYGGRGITIASKWLDFSNFLHDMGRKPNSKMTLERLDNDGPYNKDNCCWTTRKEQARNRGYYNTCSLERADEIRKLYATGNYLQKELAKIFDLSQADISQITRNVRWARD